MILLKTILSIKNILTIVFSLFVINVIMSQQTSFEINFETNYDEVPTNFVLSNEGDFIGLVRKAPPTDSIYIYDHYLYKITIDGDTSSIKYSKEDTVVTWIYVNKLVTGFVISGTGYKLGEDRHKPYIILRRLDNDLNTVWEKFYKTNMYFGANKSSILELENGDLLYACSPDLNLNMFLLLISPDGDSLNFNHFTGSQSGIVNSLTYNLDSSNILIHNEYAYYSGMGQSLCSSIIINNKLEQLGAYHYPEYFRSPLITMVKNEDTYVTGGSYQRYYLETQTLETTISAFNLDSSFNVTNEIRLTNPDTNSRSAWVKCLDIYNSDIYVGGTHNIHDIIGIHPSWFYVAKLNDTLGVEYEKYIGSEDYYVLFDITASSDGGVLLSGTRQDTNMSYIERNGFIIKLDSLGCLTSIQNDKNFKITEAIVYPNPGVNYLNIRTALHGCHFNLFDINGNLVISKELKSGVTIIRTDYLKKANYLFQITKSKKLVHKGVWIKN